MWYVLTLTNKYNKSILAFAFITNPRLFNYIIHELKYSKLSLININKDLRLLHYFDITYFLGKNQSTD